MTSSAPSSRFLSQAECRALVQRAIAMGTGGGDTEFNIETRWVGNVRWARNEINTSGDTRENEILITRNIRGASASAEINQVDDDAVRSAVRRAERLLSIRHEALENDLRDTYAEPYAHPDIWSDATYALDAQHRADVAHRMIQPAIAAGMHAAGYLEVSASGRAVMTSLGRSQYYPYTQAQYSVTVRDPKGAGSGWAGVDWHDWTKIDTEHLSAVALEKCLSSRNPVAVEPGRYTTILEPQATCDLLDVMIKAQFDEPIDRRVSEGGTGPFAGTRRGETKLGQQVLDARISISADPTDPELGFVPFDFLGNAYHPSTWVERGILKSLGYDRGYGVTQLGLNTGLPNSHAFRMSGGTATIADMIETTKRGLLVTRFSNVGLVDKSSLLASGFTRDGLWLIENGKISKPVKNFRFTESPLFALNNIEQMGVPVRVFHPGAPVVVPPVKVRDFSFTSLADAV